MRKTHIVLSVFAIFAIANILPGDALAENTPRQPLQELRMEWGQERIKHREERQGERKEFRNELQENRKEAVDDWQQAKRDSKADWAEHKTEARERFAENRDVFKQRLASSTDAVRTRFVGQKKEAVEGHLEAMYTRFDDVLAKLTSLTDRIGNRIETLDADGTDTTEAASALEDAMDAIAASETVIAETKSAINEALDGDEEISREGLRTLVQEATLSIKTAHRALVDVVRILKESSNE